MEVQSTFERYEKKFLLTQVQYERILPLLKKEMAEDCYGSYTVCNIYFDTDFYDLIRASLDKPNYKEKFRLRSYGVPGGGGLVFAEIKKKYDGIVYKRRVGASPAQIQAFLKEGERLSENLQIQRERSSGFSGFTARSRKCLSDMTGLPWRERKIRVFALRLIFASGGGWTG